MKKPTKKHIKEKLKNAIELLNEVVKIKLAPSPIHGVGVFAMRDLKKGEKLYTDIIPHQFDLPYKDFDKLDIEIRDILLGHFPLIIEGSHFMYPVCKMSAYLNHAEDANYDAKEDKALRKIKAGEEITEDYKLIPNHERYLHGLTLKMWYNISVNTFNCIKCGAAYQEKDAEAYLCIACNEERLRIAKEVDAKIASRPKKVQKSDFRIAETMGKTIPSQAGGHATFVKASDLGITFN